MQSFSLKEVLLNPQSGKSGKCFTNYVVGILQNIFFSEVAHFYGAENENLKQILPDKYRIVARTNTCYYSEKQVFGGVTIRVLCSERGCY